jgi:hypothetical protein
MTETYNFKHKYESLLKLREQQFKDLSPIAKKMLKSEGYKVTPDSIVDCQITLALQRGIVPPMWTGFAQCTKCGCVPAQAGIAYLPVKMCSWCHNDSEQVKIVGGMNRLLYWINRRKKEPVKSYPDIADIVSEVQIKTACK